MSFKVGLGYDVHKLVENRKLIIGGVNIPYEYGLLGHSDADVLIHAIMDSLIGAMGQGDIGKHFPDNDNLFKNIDSLKLLEKVCIMLEENNYKLVNIDCIIVAQNPKMSPYIKEMIKNIANTMSVKENLINIKATTEEELGFTGANLGISAKAICMIEMI